MSSESKFVIEIVDRTETAGSRPAESASPAGSLGSSHPPSPPPPPSAEPVAPLSSPAVVLAPPPPVVPVPETASVNPLWTPGFAAKKAARAAMQQGLPPSSAAALTPVGAKEGDRWEWRGDTLVSGPGGAGGPPEPPPGSSAAPSGAGGPPPPGWGSGILGQIGNQQTQLAISAATVQLTAGVVNWASGGPAGPTPSGVGGAPTPGPAGPTPSGVGAMDMAALGGTSAYSPLGSAAGGALPPVPFTSSASPAPTPSPSGPMNMTALAAHSQGPQANGSKSLGSFARGAGMAKKIVTKSLSIASKAARPTATVAADLTSNQNFKALSDATSSVAMGMIAVGGSLGPFGVALMAGVAAVGAFNQVVNAVVQRGQELSKYSGDLSMAFAKAEVRQMSADIRESQELGPEIARVIEAQSQLSTGLQEALLPIKKVIVEKLASFLEEIQQIAKEVPAYAAGLNQFANDLILLLKNLFNAGERARILEGILPNLRNTILNALNDAKEKDDPADLAAALWEYATPILPRRVVVPVPPVGFAFGP